MEKEKERRGLRAIFTKDANFLNNLLEKADSALVDINARFKVLTGRFEKLGEADEIFINGILEDQSKDDQVLLQEYEKIGEYEFRYFQVKEKVELRNETNVETQTNHSNENTATAVFKNSFHSLSYPLRPQGLAKKFDGNIGGWIGFWTQFSKYHDDPNMRIEDKFDFLLHSLKLDSPAQKLVEGFPFSRENYAKAIDLLKSRFGKDEFLIEYYVRQLLELVLTKSETRPVSELYDQLETQLRALDSLGVVKEKYAAMLFPLVESAVPENVFRIWERHRIDRNASIANPDDCLSKLLDFLKIEVEGEERLKLRQHNFESHTSKLVRNKSTKSSSQQPSAASLVSTDSSSHKNPPTCIFCDKNHSSQDCATALELSTSERSEIVKRKGGCYRCLKRYHVGAKCRSFVKCAVCMGKHYPILCTKTQDVKKNETEAQSLSMFTNSIDSVTYLQTLMAKLVSEGQEHLVRILLDSGSQRSYIVNECIKNFNLKRQGKIQLSQELFGGQRTALKSHGVYQVCLKALRGVFKCDFEVISQEKICSFVPRLRDPSIIRTLASRGVVLTDFPDVADPRTTDIQLLLGADAWARFFMPEHIQVGPSMVAINTRLGWTLLGSINEKSTVTSTLLTLNEQAHLTSFWDLEMLGIKDPAVKISQEEKDANTIQHFNESVETNDDGRYIVKLPWIDGRPMLEDNKSTALRRLKTTTKKLQLLGKYEEYNDVIKDWEKQGIVEIVPTSEADNYGHYLPHQAVIKENSTTRIRPVFDASNQDYRGNSLNQSLETGPNLIELIPVILTNFRLPVIAVSADIEKAFLQILVDPADRNALRFLWWEGSELVVFRHCRVVFGVSSSPFLLEAVIQHLLDHAPSELKQTAEKLKRSFYVDNCLSGVDHEKDLDKFIQESTQLLASGGFNLRDWISNIRDPEKTVNVLGLKWDCGSDEMSISSKLSADVPKPLTRRILLSVTQKLYDPIGFTAPTGIVPKILLQRSWGSGIGWDDPLCSEIEEEFDSWVRQIHSLQDCKIPRRIELNSTSSIHVFCDASKLAFAACIFVRTELVGEVKVNLLTAKARVSPIKHLTIPRLELMAALIGVRLYSSIPPELIASSCETIFWSDSSTALSWICTTGPWSVFVKNRVDEIRKTSYPSQWRHIPGNKNPADILSRGCSPQQLLEIHWWDGPTWMSRSENLWPHSKFSIDAEEIDRERRKTAVVASVSENSVFSLSALANNISNYNIILRTVARILDGLSRKFPRFASHCGLTLDDSQPRKITSENIINAETILLRTVQKEFFSTDRGKASLKSYTFFYDERGLLRMKSRILEGEESEEFTYPIVLPGKHPLVQRMIESSHIQNNHAGTLTLITILRERVWILQARRSVNAVVRKCVICRKQQARALKVPTPPLPVYRTRTSATFQTTGIDLAGPLYLIDSEKCWIVVFTCAVYRAVHFELVLSLSSSALIQAIRRFIARRGRPTVIHSDNATNFVGLSRALDRLNWDDIDKECALRKIKWKFNPPAAAWWGGYWERLIRILKDLLKKNLGRAQLNYQEMITLICECESIMNSRPLTYLSEEPDELAVLKPSMFIMSLPNTGVNDLDYVDSTMLRTRWNHLKRVRQVLRQRFAKEYIAFLRVASMKTADVVKVGDIVLIGSDEKKRLEWILAKVIELKPGRDGITRVARLRTTKGEMSRPLQRLYPLELHSSLGLDEPQDDKSAGREPAVKERLVS